MTRTETGVFLPYGIDSDNQLVHIDQVARGKTALRCPYCATPLIARHKLMIEVSRGTALPIGKLPLSIRRLHYADDAG